MKDRQNITIGLLLATSVVLAILLLIVNSDNTAMAESSSRAGDYILIVGQWVEGTDVLYVTDIAAKRMNVYTTDINTWSINLFTSTDLEQGFSGVR